jgi:hypothetical protein
MGAADGLAQLHVFLSSPDGVEESEAPTTPFVTLSQSGRFSRVYKAGLFDPRGNLIRLLALKVQRVDGTTAAVAGGPHSETAADTDAAWRDRADVLRKYSQPRFGAPTAFFLDELGDDNAVPRIGARVFCKHRRLFFRLRSPGSFEPLRDCRDDACLARHGLPTYRMSNARFLYSPQDAEAGAARFYGDSPLTDGIPPSVAGGEEECFRDQGKIVHAKAVIRERDPKLHEELEQTFPCYQCPEASRCFPEGDGYARVTDRLVAFSFHDFQAVASDLFDLQFDVFADCLGGRPIGPWVAALRDAATHAANHQLIGMLRALRSARRAVFLDPTADGTGALEVLLLKWTLFTRVIRCVHRLYGAGHRPHLHLSARHVVVRLTPEDGVAPALWNFTTALLGLDGAMPVPVGVTPSVLLFRPPPAPEPYYTDPRMPDGSDFGRWRRAVVTFTEVTPDPENPRQLRVRGRLLDSSRIAAEPDGDDVLRIDLPSVDGVHRITVLCRPETDAVAGGMAFTGLAAEQKGVIDLNLYVSKTLDDVNYAYYPYCGLRYDLHALGVLLLRALVVNGRQDLPTVYGAARRLAAALNASAPASASDAWLQGKLEEISRDPLWETRNILYDPGPSGAGPLEGIPRDLWARLLSVGFRMLGVHAGVGFGPRLHGRSAEGRVLGDIVDVCVALERELTQRWLGRGGGVGAGVSLAEVLASFDGPPTSGPGEAGK